MGEMRPILFVGSRRSGTVTMNQIINSHPKMYSSFERYVVWMLYRCYNGQEPGKDPPTTWFPKADEKFALTLDNSRKVFADMMSGKVTHSRLREAFFTACKRNMRARPDGRSKSPDWIGEKNPEIAMPFLWEFVDWLLPDAKYIHMVRHPIAVAKSKNFYAKTYGCPESWKLPIEHLVREWVVLEGIIGSIIGVDIITVRLEDLWSNPEKEVERVYNFFDVNQNETWKTNRIATRGREYDTEINFFVPGLKELMEMYGYE